MHHVCDLTKSRQYLTHGLPFFCPRQIRCATEQQQLLRPYHGLRPPFLASVHHGYQSCIPGTSNQGLRLACKETPDRSQQSLCRRVQTFYREGTNQLARPTRHQKCFVQEPQRGGFQQSLELVLIPK